MTSLSQIIKSRFYCRYPDKSYPTSFFGRVYVGFTSGFGRVLVWFWSGLRRVYVGFWSGLCIVLVGFLSGLCLVLVGICRGRTCQDTLVRVYGAMECNNVL